MSPTTCIHYRGTQHLRCKAGVLLSDVTPQHGKLGWGLRVPCHTQPVFKGSPTSVEEFAKRGTCPNLRLPTEAEIEEEKSYVEKKMLEMALIDPIVEQVRQRKEGGDFPCPVCKSGTLKIAVCRSNGHTRGACTTKDCYNWME